VRGPYGGAVVNERFAARLGFAAAKWIAEAKGRRNGRVLIGRDTRASGAPLAEATASGVAAAGLSPLSLGVLPTPAVARAVTRSGAALGVVITASHNPASDNGIKFFSPDGMKLTDAEEAAVEAALDGAPEAFADAGTLPDDGGAAERDYIRGQTELLPPGALRGWKIVLDTANGATARTSAAVLSALGADLARIGDAPDGANINAGVGSECADALARRVVAETARLGVAHDGDGDRCVLCDGSGAVLDGDELMAILATDALRQGTLREKTLVATVHSNMGLDMAVRAAGGRVLRAAVGDRYVLEEMLRSGAGLGGESSGHVIFAEVAPTGDGLTAALRVLGVMLRTGRTLAELRAVLRKLPQATLALRVSERRPLENCPALSAEMKKLEAELGSGGRVLVRYSGTEAKLRLLVEGGSDAVARAGVSRLAAAATTDLGAL
jgi:phosphoglucosamine mutase